MSVLLSKDKKEIIVTCKCGCMSSYHILIDDEYKEYGQYAFMCFMKSNYDTEFGPWTALKIKLKKIWCVIRDKDYYYSDTVMSLEDFEEFKKYVNQF